MKWPMISAIAAAALVITAGFLWQADPVSEAGSASLAQLSPGFGEPDFASARDAANDRVAEKRALLRAAPDQWLKREVLALALMGRFRLSGDPGDLEEARALLDSGTALAPDPSGPNLTRAALALTEHNLEQAETALDRFDRAVVKSRKDRAQAAAMRGDIAFQRGQRVEAEALYRRADGLLSTLGSKLRLAELELRTGDPFAARRITERALREYSPSPQEFTRTALLLANQSYAAGDIDGAGEWIERAAGVFPGFWLAEAYRAQQLAVEGDSRAAVRQLEALAKSREEPEVIDALAGILGEMGETERAAAWSARSARLWEERLRRAHASYRLHAAEHYLDFGDPARALELARQEVASRPTPNAIEVMASALTANGEPGEALRWLDRAKRSGWEMTSLHLARAEALETLGRDDEACAVLANASEGASLADDPRRPLIRFGHY